MNFLVETVEGGDENLHHAASPKWKLKVLNTNQKDTQVLNSAILQSVKENPFSKETFPQYGYIVLKFEQSMHEAGASHCQSASLHFPPAVQGSQQEFSKIWLFSI